MSAPKILNKKKIFNDPVYGFITIRTELIFDVIQHRHFQRLRRIKQLGVADFVYPGALHTRFHHALGAMHLMDVALANLRSKGHTISEEEYESALLAILLHDIGHGPFSHVLEDSILREVPHEQISLLFMERLNEEFGGKLTLAIQMFSGGYERQFFHQLVSGQLDIDRLDYLRRDCFFTGVSEGSIGADRIIKMLDLHEGNLVVEEKGIYSVENFLNARRLMYWQVYMHKTSISVEQTIIKIINRARHLLRDGVEVETFGAISYFLRHRPSLQEFRDDPEMLERFSLLDDSDILFAIKQWTVSHDRVLSYLSLCIIERKLLKVVLSNEAPSLADLAEVRKRLIDTDWTDEEIDYLVMYGEKSNAGYVQATQKIIVLTKKGQQTLDVAEASDLPNIKALSQVVTKYYLCYPKNVNL